jgi:choline dehydrogenase
MLGAGESDLLIHDGKRESTASAHLRPALSRPNLTVHTHATARRLTIEHGRCTGIEYAVGGEVRHANAGEVVLCAGAVGSPQLLMLSGIGPADELRALGIEPVADLPGVGRNLQDHTLLAGIRYRAERPLPTSEVDGATVLAKLDDGAHGPDLLLGAMNFDYHFEWQLPAPNSFSLVAGHMRAHSRGTIRLASSDPDDAPLIDPRYLTEEHDLRALITGVETMDQIVQTGVFDDFGGHSETTALLALDEPALIAAVHDALGSYFHLAGTCRMGVDAEAVVGPELRVNGVTGLRVADASIMPVVVSCNTNAACVMIGEKASDLVRGQSLREEAGEEIAQPAA